jgi:hypothetical protein
MIQVKTNIQESLSQTIIIMWLVIAIIEDLDIYCDIYIVLNLYVVSCSTFITEYSDIKEKIQLSIKRTCLYITLQSSIIAMTNHMIIMVCESDSCMFVFTCIIQNRYYYIWYNHHSLSNHKWFFFIIMCCYPFHTIITVKFDNREIKMTPN